MALGGGDGNVGELPPVANAAEHQAAAAHVSAPGEFGGKEEPLAKNLEQRLDVFWRGDAAEKYDFAAIADMLGKEARVAFERKPIAALRCRYRCGGDSAQDIAVQGNFRRKQAAAGRDDERTGRLRRRLGKGSRIGEFAAEVKPADKGEGFAQGKLAIAKPKGEREAGFFPEDQLSADPGGIGRGEQEDARGRLGIGGGKRGCSVASLPGGAGRRPVRRSFAAERSFPGFLRHRGIIA